MTPDDVFRHRHDALPCAPCGRPLTAATASSSPPMAGDFVVCLHCGAVMRYVSTRHGLVPALVEAADMHELTETERWAIAAAKRVAERAVRS